VNNSGDGDVIIEQAVMEKVLRILMLEDTPTDAELAEHELRKAGIVFTSMRVETQDAFVQALDEFRPDIVLSDYKLPDFSGMAALEIIQRDHPEVPVIIVTGALSDVKAVELIQAGAMDYVLKDRLARLAPAVQRALEAEQGIRSRNATELALRESVVFQNSLLDAIPIPVFYKDRDGRYLGFNRAYETFFGATKDQLIGKTVFDISPQELAEIYQAKDTELIENGGVQQYEAQVKNKHGELREVIFYKAVFADSRENVGGLIGAILDITERNQAEKLLTEYAAIVESTDDAIVGKTLDGIITSWNKGAERMLGYSSVEIIGHSILDLIPEERHHEEQEILEKIRHGESVRHYETIRRCKDGHKIDLSVTISPLKNAQGNIVGASKIARDISARKQKDALLHSLSRKLKAISRCNQLLVRAENEQELLNGICKLICDEAGYLMAWVGFAENDEQKTVRPVAYSGYEQGYLDGIQITWADTERGQVPIGIAIRTRVAAVNNDFQNYPGLAPWREAVKRRGFRSSVAIPLVSKGQVLGSLNIYSAELQAFENEEVEMLQELANDIAYGVLTLRTRAEKELAEAELHAREQEFRAMIENSPDNIARYDTQCRRIYVNPALQANFDVPIAEILGTTAEYRSPLLDVPEYMQRMQNALKTGCEEWMEVSWISPQGVDRWGDVRLSPEFGKDGKVVSLLSITRDITERKRAEEKLLITASVFDNTQEAIIITDTNISIIDVNSAFTKITGYSSEEVIGKNPRMLSSGLQDKAFYAAMWQSLEHKREWRGEVWSRRKSGEIYAELLSISTICDNKGKVLRYVGVFSDISYLKEHESELSRIANYDALTGIPNRVLLADRMRQAIAQTAREQNIMAVCYLDLDGFKPINDTMGHEAGDQVLIEVARRIENTIRGGDTVARLGGDEFVVLLLGQEKSEECETALKRLITAIAHPITFKNKSITISASIGVSIYPLDNEDPDTLLRHADQAMYIAKQSGKNRFNIYDPALEQHARDQHKFMESIHHGLEHGQFELYYQPKVNLRTKALVGAEALIRWRHPERGLLSPAEFLRHIENTDLDVEVGEWVTATALAQMNHWRNTGLDIEVSINISGYHMESPRFAEKLGQQLAHYPDMPPGKLQIEVLETVALNDITIVCEIIESCRKLGVGFALDDFGTGYSSLSYLSRLPVDVLKIDQSFVRDMLEDKGDIAIVQGIIALARAFDHQTVAEGIETEEHYRVLLDMGCELGQGYGIGRPMPANELLSWRPNSHF
jgi:diguanylate cyclase (GGDEF)-like protein/PAS domain S-box-containing protein